MKYIKMLLVHALCDRIIDNLVGFFWCSFVSYRYFVVNTVFFFFPKTSPPSFSPLFPFFLLIYIYLGNTISWLKLKMYKSVYREKSHSCPPKSLSCHLWKQTMIPLFLCILQEIFLPISLESEQWHNKHN